MTNQVLVEEEISRMIDEDSSLMNTPRFNLRTSASKNILRNMDEKELNDLKVAGEKMGKKGYSEEHQRR